MLTGLFPVHFASAYVSWWDQGWGARREIVINNTGTKVLTDYQICVNLSYETDMMNDFKDLRFVQDNGSGPKLLDHWIERQVNGQWALVWVEVSKISPGSNSIYMYFGNSSAPSISNGAATFPFFDDLNSNTVPLFNTSNWVGPTGNHHTYDYYLRDNPEASVLKLPGRLIWRMKMTQYQVSNWGTAQWWAIRKGPNNVLPANETDMLEIGIYANSDVNADDNHPSMMLDAKRDNGSTLSSDRPLVPINLNQYYTYSLAASDTKASAKVVTDDGTVLWNPSVDVCPNNTKYWHMGHFVGIQGNFGVSTLTWDGAGALKTYSKTEHVYSFMEFSVDQVMKL